MADSDEPDYLWDKSGAAAPDVARLEQLLAPLAHRGEPPNPARARGSRRRWVFAAGALAAAAVLVLLWKSARRGEAECRGGDGFAFSADHPVSCERGRGKSGTLVVGGFIETADGAARVTVADIGSVELAARSRLALRRSARVEHRLALEHGKLHARVLAPPRLFVIETPSATAIDLGCEYDLEVDAGGNGRLRVTSGQVELAGRGGTLVLVPAGAGARFSREHGVGVPLADGAAPALREAAARFERGQAPLSELLAATGPGDVITLANLLALAAPAEREQVYERLQALAPPPATVEKASVVSGDAHAITRWRDDAVGRWLAGEAPSAPPQKGSGKHK